MIDEGWYSDFNSPSDEDENNENILAALDDIDNDLALVLHQSVDDNIQNHAVAPSFSSPPSAVAGLFDTSELYARILDLDSQDGEMSTQTAGNIELPKRQQTNLKKRGDRIDRHENHLSKPERILRTTTRMSRSSWVLIRRR